MLILSLSRIQGRRCSFNFLMKSCQPESVSFKCVIEFVLALLPWPRDHDASLEQEISDREDDPASFQCDSRNSVI